MGLRVQISKGLAGLMKAWGLGFGGFGGVRGLGLGFRVWGLGFGVWGLGFRGLGYLLTKYNCTYNPRISPLSALIWL